MGVQTSTRDTIVYFELVIRPMYWFWLILRLLFGQWLYQEVRAEAGTGEARRAGHVLCRVRASRSALWTQVGQGAPRGEAVRWEWGGARQEAGWAWRRLLRAGAPVEQGWRAGWPPGWTVQGRLCFVLPQPHRLRVCDLPRRHSPYMVLSNE